MEVAKQKGLKPLKYHLLPRRKGFVFLVKHLKGNEVMIGCYTEVTFNRARGYPY